MSEVIEAPTRELAGHNAGPAANSPMGMMLAAMQQGISPDQIREMMALQQQWQAIEAKKAYDAAFAAFKAEAVTIVKGKSRSDGPLKNQKYAELHDVVNAVTPALSKHGLSSSWKLTKDDKDWMEVTCYLRHVGGHEESVSMGGPPDVGSARNAIQARASTKTYLERYTLKAITGLSEQNDDNDGAGAEKDTALCDEWISRVAQAGTLDQLMSVWREGAAVIDKTDSLKSYNAFKKACTDKREMLKQGEA
ncbi:ERF family protein [Bordetella avium]|uniref:ERF family protein n=1 Tax=Bordetella avium TaxID=521 RepID=UPI000E69975F|nr:ERF family protein [Bordetella avium]RIQ51022.1 single-stranded DNA-binding protein [Bordetella avium]